MTVSVDPSSWALIRPGAIPDVDLLLPNEREAEVLGERDEMVVKLGAAGARWGDVHVPAEPVEVVDTTGAGDAFAAGLLGARLEGADRTAALEAGCAAAARVGGAGRRAAVLNPAHRVRRERVPAPADACAQASNGLRGGAGERAHGRPRAAAVAEFAGIRADVDQSPADAVRNPSPMPQLTFAGASRALRRVRLTGQSIRRPRMPEAVIVDAIRTPIGRAAKGSLKDVRADDLAAVPLKALVERNPGVDFGQTDDMMMGCGFQLGEAGYNVGRNAALLAGIDHHVPARPSTASAPPRCRRSGWPSTRSRPARATSTSPPASRPSRASPPTRRSSRTRGSTAPTARRTTSTSRWGSRPRTSPGAARSAARRRTSGPRPRRTARSRRATAATSTPRSCPVGEVTRDDGPRPGTTMEKLAELKPAFDPENGTVTAGNSCPLNDGAAAVLVMSDERAKALGLEPKARIVASSVAAIRPGDHGPRPDPGGQGRARAGRHEDRRHRHRRAQRGVRRPGRAVPRRARASTPRSSTRSAARSRSATRSG